MTFRIRAIIAAIASALAVITPSCTSHSGSDITIIDPAAYHITYGDDLVWTQKLADENLVLAPFTLTHWSNGTRWTGFVPSRATDTRNSSDWTDRQWTSVTGAGIGAAGMPYLVAGCDTTESLDAIPPSPAAMIRMTYSGERFTPRMLWLTNTAEGFYRMKTGQPGIPAFSRSDWAKIIVTGVRDGVKTGSETIWVARDGQFLGDPSVLVNSLSNGGGWFMTDVKKLGEVDYIYFQMQSNRPDFVPTFVLGSYTYTD